MRELAYGYHSKLFFNMFLFNCITNLHLWPYYYFPLFCICGHWTSGRRRDLAKAVHWEPGFVKFPAVCTPHKGKWSLRERAGQAWPHRGERWVSGRMLKSLRTFQCTDLKRTSRLIACQQQHPGRGWRPQPPAGSRLGPRPATALCVLSNLE